MNGFRVLSKRGERILRSTAAVYRWERQDWEPFATAAQDNRPIPRFLLIDQPTQVYFPSEQVYKAADGSVQKTEADADLNAVRRLVELLLKFTREDAPGFQLIVTEHANLRDQWFQEALVEQPWTKPPALVPEGWQDQ